MDKKSFIIFSSLFLVELLIAKYVTQPFIRYWLGDFLIVIMIFYFLKSFIKTQPRYLAIAVLLFAFSIEILQKTALLDILNLRDNKIANLILGNTFSFSDLLAYTLGIVLVLLLENKKAT